MLIPFFSPHFNRRCVRLLLFSIFRIRLTSRRLDHSKEPVRKDWHPRRSRTSSEEEMVGWTVCWRATTKFQGPESYDLERFSIRQAQSPFEMTRARIKGSDAPTSEVADQQPVTEHSEVVGSNSQTPGSIEEKWSFEAGS